MRDLTKGNIYKSFILFAVPLVLSSILSQAYHIIDTMIAGKFLGENGLAAIGATSQAITLASAVFWGFGTGFGINIAKLFGAKEYSKIKSNIINVILILTLIIITVSLLLIAFSDVILNVLKVENDIRADAKIYFIIYISGLCFITLNSNFISIMNALGASSFPFLMSLLSAALNISGNILSVTVLKMGVGGIALSSVLAALAVDAVYILKLKACFKEFGISGEKTRFSIFPFKETLRYSAPSSLQQTAMYIAAFAMSPIINGIGAAATAGYTVVMRIYDINAATYQSASKTLSNYAAQCVGAGEYGKIRKGLFVGLVQSMLFALPVVLACCIFAPQVNSIFFPSGYAGESLDYAVLFSRVYLPFSFFNVINNLFHSFFRGVAAMRLLIIATVLGSVVRIAAGFIFAGMFGMEGVYIGWIVSWIAEAIFMLAVYLLKFRNTEMIRRYAERSFN